MMSNSDIYLQFIANKVGVLLIIKNNTYFLNIILLLISFILKLWIDYFTNCHKIFKWH